MAPDKNEKIDPGMFVKRKHLRFKPDPLDVAYIDFESRLGKQFDPHAVGLIVEEAPLGGCGIAIRHTERLQTGDICSIKVGRLAPLKAEVCWRNQLDNMVIRMGLRFLE